MSAKQGRLPWRGLAAAALAGIVAMALAFAMWRYQGGPPIEGRPALARLPLTAPPGEDRIESVAGAAPAPALGEEPRLYDAGRVADEPDAVPFSDFVARLKSLASDEPSGDEDSEGDDSDEPAEPAAKRFVKELMAQQGVRAAVENLQKRAERGEPVTANDLLDAVRAEPEFRKLVARFAGQAEGSLALYRDPVLRRFLQDTRDVQEASGGQATGRSRKWTSAKAATAAARTASPGGPSGSGEDRQTLARLPEAQLRAGTATAAEGPTPGGPGVGGPEPARGKGGKQDSSKAAGGGGGGGGSGGPAGESAPGAHDVQVRLPAPGAATSERMKRFLEENPWLAQLGSERLGRIEALIPQHGLWGSCFALQLYPDCKAACGSDPEGKCLAKEAWTSCLEWKGHAECVSACHYAPRYCTVPAEIEGPECQTRKMCSYPCGRRTCERYCPPPIHEYCAPSWPGNAPAAPPGSGTPVGPQTYNFVAGDKATCEQSIQSRFDVRVSCSMGGGCGRSCGKPGPGCESANPQQWGFCLDPSDPALPPRKYNFVNGGGKAACEQSVRDRLGISATCSLGGGCGISCGNPGPGCPSANPQLWGVCLDGPAIPPWVLNR